MQATPLRVSFGWLKGAPVGRGFDCELQAVPVHAHLRERIAAPTKPVDNCVENF